METASWWTKTWFTCLKVLPSASAGRCDLGGKRSMGAKSRQCLEARRGRGLRGKVEGGRGLRVKGGRSLGADGGARPQLAVVGTTSATAPPGFHGRGPRPLSGGVVV